MESIIVFAPLVGSIICGFGWKFIGEKAAMWTATGLLFYACFVSWASFLGFDGVTSRSTCSAGSNPARSRPAGASALTV